jgi:hypothetical protein
VLFLYQIYNDVRVECTCVIELQECEILFCSVAVALLLICAC